MQKINWEQFKIKNENRTKAFEDLCYHLFCRKYKLKDGIRANYNQIGLETHPINDERGDLIGFQAKFFDNKLSDKSSVKQINKSITKSKEEYKGLKKITIYTHHTFGSDDPKYKQDIETKAKPIKIEWFLGSQFEIAFSQPSNLDLAQLYFGLGDELGFIKNIADPEIHTFLQSSEYLELPLEDKGKNTISDLKTTISTSPNKEFLITGTPGSGKSYLIYKLFEQIGGLDKNDEKKMLDHLTTQGAVPMLINLKNCATDSIENILRGRQNDSKVRGNTLGFMYLFDGLDELDQENADNVLSYITELSKNNNTKKIIISCRSGNLNKIKAKIYLKDILEYKISDLEQIHIDIYFNAKSNADKNTRLAIIKNKNPDLLNEIKDILLISLFWDTIDKLDETSTVVDLLDNKIELLLDDPKHRKNIELLNLFNPKKEEIIALNQEISFEFQKEFKFLFSQEDLQALIFNKFSRLDYKSTNTILNYLADLFFENSYSDQSQTQTYAYQHRRYQDLFFAQKLKSEYEKDPKILRNLKVLSNHEFFEKIFLKYLRKEYNKENNLIGFIELNLIDVYLGKHKGWGADDAYYKNSSEFIPALASQNDLVFEELINDENLEIRNKLTIDQIELKRKFDEWNWDKNNYRISDYIKNIWENHVANLLESISIFHKNSKFDFTNDLKQELNRIIQIYEENEFHKNLSENDHPKDPFWDKWDDLLYIKLVINNEEISNIFENLIKYNYKTTSEPINYSFQEEGKEKLVKSFIRVCLNYKKQEFLQLINEFDEYEFLAFLDVLKSLQYLPILFQDASLQEKIKTFVESFSSNPNESNVFILFYKKIFNTTISQSEIEFAQSELEKLRNDREIDRHRNKTNIRHALISYVLDEYSFEDFLKKQDGHPFRYYNELGLYASLFKDYIELLRDNKNIESIVRDYVRYINFYIEGTSYRKYLKVDMSFLWAFIFFSSPSDVRIKQNLKNIIFKEENNIIPFNFCLQLNNLNSELFLQLINETDLEYFEEELLNWEDDFPSYVDRCFHLALFFSQLNPKKALDYISKGINDGILRHGWRKDIIVSYNLVDALEILWRNNWDTKETLPNYTKEVFNLTLRVTDITDGKGTWQGPYNVINLIAKYDLQLAEEFKKTLIKKKGYENYSISVITSILIGKIKLGYSIEELERGMTEYRRDYDYKGKPRRDYYEEKFKVYLEIATSDLYTEEEKKLAFEKAYDQIDEIIKQKIDYYLRDDDFNKEKIIFKELCKKYQKEYKIPPEKHNESHVHIPKRKTVITEESFINDLNYAKTKQKIRGLYIKLGNYNNGIVLSRPDSWKTLVEKTYSINGNIFLFIDLLKENHFPHIGFWTLNSKYFHFGLAVALTNLNTRKEILEYLSENTGHGGFINIMKAYEQNRDIKTSLELFERFLKMCHLLVD